MPEMQDQAGASASAEAEATSSNNHNVQVVRPTAVVRPNMPPICLRPGQGANAIEYAEEGKRIPVRITTRTPTEANQIPVRVTNRN